MNNEIFQRARLAYEARDYERALATFTECLRDSSRPISEREMGRVLHQIGNCLVKLGNYHEAIHAYTQATGDPYYDGVGTVNNNLGMCYAALHDYENAVRYFELAVSDAKYDAPYKAYSGMGTALLKLGQTAEAGAAFRQAALDERNQDPTKALLNLGICFMVLGRAQDAVTAYESALQFDMPPSVKNKLCANLGQAYVSSGQMQNAVAAFESAIADKTYYLSDSASVDYQRAVAAVASASAQATQAIAPISVDTSGLDVTGDGQPVATDVSLSGSYAPYSGVAASPGSYDGNDRFFNASDEELEQWSKGLAKKDRKRRSVGLKILVAVILLIVLAFGAAIFLYTQGYGYPSQETVVKQLFADKEAAASTLFAENIDVAKATTALAPVVEDPNVTIDGINKEMSESTVYATAHTPEGGEVTYRIMLSRSDLIGWKVASIELYFHSQQGA